MAQVGALESRAKCCPRIATILRGEESVVVEGQHDKRTFRMFPVHGYVGDMLVLEAVVGGGESSTAVIADLHAFALCADDDALRILGIDDQSVDDPITGSHALEILVVDSLPEAAGGSSIERFVVVGIHANDLCAAEGVGNALILDPLLSAVGAVVDARACGGVDVIRIRRINDDAHHVGIVDHSFDHGEPVLAAIGGFPWQVIRARVNNVVVLRVECYGVKIFQVGMIVGSNFGPACAFICGTIHAGQ